MRPRREVAAASIAVLFLLFQSNPAQAALCPPPAPGGGDEPVDDCGEVFRVECPAQGTVLTGFKMRVGGSIGIVTALHGVVGCPDLTAFNLHDSYPGLRVARVDLSLDAAFLISAALELISQKAEGGGQIILISDGLCEVGERWLSRVLALRARRRVRTLTIVVDIGPCSERVPASFSDRIVRWSELGA